MLMRMGSRPNSSSVFSRATHVACALVVISYILFNVLDLDGSDLPKLLATTERVAIVAEASCDTSLDDFSNDPETWSDIALVPADSSELSARAHGVEISLPSPVGIARSHGWCVGLARNSLPD